MPAIPAIPFRYLADPPLPQINDVTWQHAVCDAANGSIRMK